MALGHLTVGKLQKLLAEMIKKGEVEATTEIICTRCSDYQFQEEPTVVQAVPTKYLVTVGTACDRLSLGQREVIARELQRRKK